MYWWHELQVHFRVLKSLGGLILGADTAGSYPAILCTWYR